MPLFQQNTLTILGVKDYLKSALDANLKRLNQLDKDSNLDKLNAGLIKTLGVATKVGIGVAAAIGGGLISATNKYRQFQTEFTQLENLNLDKSKGEIKALEKQVLDSAYKVGANPIDISKGFFDVQSGTGFFGKGVADIVEQTKQFSTAVQSDFNTTLEGAIKGIRNFNLESKDIGKFFESSAKTVQVGIVTFEQLARVQTDYAGAANTANQSVDSANKLFAVFTTKAKSAEEAATLTKGAFTDLFKEASQSSFQKLGISLFDKQTGKAKQLDQIVGELNDKFRPLRGNDRALNSLVNQFTGSEGLVQLIGEVAKNGDNMLKTFEAFDRTEFSLEKALKNAKGDLDVMSSIVKNKLDVSLTRIGEKLVPYIVDGFKYLDETILPNLETKLPSIIAGLERGVSAIAKTIEQIGKAITFIDREVEKLDNYRVIDRKQNKANEDKLIREQGFPIEAKGLDIKAKDFIARNFKESLVGNEQATNDFIDKAKRAGILDDPKAQQIIAKRLAGKSTGIDEYLDKANSLNERINSLGSPKTDAPTGKPSPAGASSSQLAGNIRGVVAGGDQVRNINVTIQKMTGIENLNTTTIKESTAQIERAIRELLVKSVRDSEIAISQ